MIELLTLPEASRQCGVHEDALYRHARRNQLPAKFVRRCYIVAAPDLAEFVQKYRAGEFDKRKSKAKESAGAA